VKYLHKQVVVIFAVSKKNTGLDYSERKMELLQQYESASEEEQNSNDETKLRENSGRSVYLVTYSQADINEIPTREKFAQVLVQSFEHIGSKVVQWCCSKESHKDGGIHYHASIKLKKVTRWKGSKKYLKDMHGITVHYSDWHHNYYSAWKYVTKTDEDFKQSDNHPDLSNSGEPITNAASQKVKQNKRKRKNEAVKRAVRKKKEKRLTNVEVSQMIIKKKITNLTALQALAYEQSQEGKGDLMLFILSRSRKTIMELLDTTWEIKEAGEKLERARKTRMQLLQDQLRQPCSRECSGEWLHCASEVLANNNVSKLEFANCVKELLTKGRGKYRNIMITGPANCGKTFLLKPLTVIYHTFCNPASGSFAWVGVEDKECIFLNDFRWSPQLIPWHDLLLLLEGELVHLPAPKTHFSQDIQLVKDTPVFCTSKRPLIYIKNSVMDERETDMMNVRWKIFEFKQPIPEDRQRRLQPCSTCFAKLILS